MDSFKEKGKKGLIMKTWQRCRSIGRKIGTSSARSDALKTKSKSWPRYGSSTTAAAGVHEYDDGDSTPAGRGRSRKGRVAPEGCFSVYVGPQKQRFVVKTEYLNHPLFRVLLEEAESEYGYTSDGPLALPCDVNLFVQVLAEMDSDDIQYHRHGCTFVRMHSSSYHLLTPPRFVSMNQL